MPNIHLGSFSRMTFDFDQGRYPVPQLPGGRRAMSAIETNGQPFGEQYGMKAVRISVPLVEAHFFLLKK
jgi:hypothetical protein